MMFIFLSFLKCTFIFYCAAARHITLTLNDFSQGVGNMFHDNYMIHFFKKTIFGRNNMKYGKKKIVQNMKNIEIFKCRNYFNLAHQTNRGEIKRKLFPSMGIKKS